MQSLTVGDGTLSTSTTPPITVNPSRLASFLVSYGTIIAAPGSPVLANSFFSLMATASDTAGTSPSAPSTAVVAGSPFSLTVSAQDSFGNIISGYTGTIHFTSSDKQVAVGTGLPSDYHFTSGDNGVYTFVNTVVLKTAGNQTVTVNDTGTASIKGNITVAVTPAPAARFQLKTPGSVGHGKDFNYNVTAQDPYGNTATGYQGTVSFSSTAGANAVLPGNYTFTTADKGLHAFSATFTVIGSFTITATDTITSSTGTSSTIKVT
jgi:hypothetical protein